MDHSQVAMKPKVPPTGLDYFGARYFSGAQGRFTSPDPKMFPHDITDPQSWNKYGYTRNNPLRYVDPDGRDFIDNAIAYIRAFFQPVSSVEAVTNPRQSGPPTGPGFDEHDAAVGFTREAGKNYNKMAEFYEAADPTGIASVARNAMEGNGSGTMLAMSGVLIPGGSKEIRVVNEGFEKARNAALSALGDLGSAVRTNTVGKQSVVKGLVTGFETRVDGVFKQFRLDFDPNKGAHSNVTVGKTKYSFEFKATEEQLKKLLEGNAGK